MKNVKSQIKKIARDFNLKFESEWFQYMWIPIKQEILTEYIGDCPDPAYKKYGKSPKERIKNIDKFVNSKDFKKCLKRFGGQVADKKDWKQEKNWINQIKNDKIRKELLKLHYRIKKKFAKTNKLALLSIPHNQKQKEWQLKNCLRHEWIHILLEQNKISFQKLNKKHWKYDEGLVTYLEFFADRKLKNLEKMRDKEDYPMEKQYYVYGIRFRGILENKKTPKERKQEIIKFMDRLNNLKVTSKK